MRVAYWSTACLEPEIEAVSKEIEALSQAFAGSWVFSVHPQLRLQISRSRRVFGANPRLDIFLRAAFRTIGYRFDVHHIYGDATPWIYHKSLRGRPLVHTITQDSGHIVPELVARCAAIVVQTQATRSRVIESGADQRRVELWYPGIDLKRFVPRPTRRRDNDPTRVLFATAPRSASEMEERGVHLLLNAAASSPGLQFRFLYRPWSSGYSSLAATRTAITERGTENVELTEDAVADMPALYPQFDFTVIPFTTRSGGKECPNSALESLACGVPVLVSKACPFAEFVEQHTCGVTFAPTSDGLLAAIESGRLRYRTLSENARRCAEKYLSADRLVERYRRLYSHVLEEKAGRRTPESPPKVSA